jgi:hypothetical protein
MKLDRTFHRFVPTVYQEFHDTWEDCGLRRSCLEAYQAGEHSFIPYLLPEQALELSAHETLNILRGRFGEAVELALHPNFTDPNQYPAEIPTVIRSPAIEQEDGGWLKRTNMVGINVRTVGSFWNIVKYALTLPFVQSSIHILPIWEPGVVGSLYGMSSWELNQEFYSPELETFCPTLNTNPKQLRAVVNLLHMMGKAVGMDVIPHTDRFSQITLAYPEYFEWLQRQDTVIVDHSANLHIKVQEQIFKFLEIQGTAVPGDPVPLSPGAFFQESFGEAKRLQMLFGLPQDSDARQVRRQKLVQHLYRYGYEPVPATMSPPYRGLQVDRRPEAKNVDGNGLSWRDYQITQPTPMSRVFGPLARYKLYEALDDNAAWAIDFSQPRRAVWDYVCDKYAQVQRRYGFDFMRGDMSHVQMRGDGVPAVLDPYYDLLGAVKNHIRHENHAPYFGYFAETFLAARDVMGYGEEIDHLEAAEAETTLGDLQSTVLGSPEFLQRFRYYLDLAATRLCKPNFTVITADKDDPRFDMFYQGGNEARLFIALLLTDLPSYMALGFETRDVHYEPAPNEHYTKLFVFQITSGPKTTRGPYQWGRNGSLYSFISRFKLYLDTHWPKITERSTRWLIPPDATGGSGVIAWTLQGSPDYVYVVNTDLVHEAVRSAIPRLNEPGEQENYTILCEFSTSASSPETIERLTFNGKHYKLTRIAPGEGRVYRVTQKK